MLKGPLEGHFVLVEKGAEFVVFGTAQVGLHRCGTERLDFARNENFAACHVFADTLARITQYDDAPAVHHVAGHEVGILAAEQRAFLHHLTGPRAHVALDHDFGAADGDGRNGAGISADDHGAGVHVVGQSPTDIAFDLEPRAIGEAGAEISRRTMDPHGYRISKPDADVVPGVRVQDIDILAVRTGFPDQVIGFPNRQDTEVYRDHVAHVPGGGSVVSSA